MSGPPPHIAQIIAGHRDINVTMSYKAFYADEAVQYHLAFLAGAEDRLTQIDQRSRTGPVDLGIPTINGTPRPRHATHHNSKDLLLCPL